MDFSLSEEQRLMLDAVDGFVQRHLPLDEVRRRDMAHEPPDDLLPQLAALGIPGLPIPEHFGGMGRDWVTVALVQERFARHAGMMASLINRVVCFGAMSILKHGSDAQKDALLPRVVKGELLFSLALSEPGAGSDAGALVTSADRSDGGWCINGRKSWVSGADTSHYLVAACRTERGSRGSAGVSMFLVPRNAPGISMTPLEKVGNNSLSCWDVGFDDVTVEGDALLGEEGYGFPQMMMTLQYSRTGQAANAVGQAQAAVDLALAHALGREQFGRPIGKFQVIQHRLADMQTRVDQARWMLYHLAWRIANDLPCRKEAAQAKLVASEALLEVAQHGMQIMASAGYSSDSDMQRIWRDSRLYTFGEGPSEIQRDLIAGEMGL